MPVERQQPSTQTRVGAENTEGMPAKSHARMDGGTGYDAEKQGAPAWAALRSACAGQNSREQELRGTAVTLAPPRERRSHHDAPRQRERSHGGAHDRAERASSHGAAATDGSHSSAACRAQQPRGRLQ